MSIGKKDIELFLEKFDISQIIKIDNIVEEILRDKNIPEYKILEVFDKNKVATLWYLEEKLKCYTLEELIPIFMIKSDCLIWVLNPKNELLNIGQKERYKKRKEIYNIIESSFTPQDWEVFCSLVLTEIYDFEISNITPLSKDGWIDFFWKYKIVNSPVCLFNWTPIYLYGQAKKYSNPIWEDDIKNFTATRKSIIEWRDTRIKNKIPKEFTNDPYLSLLFFITTSRFTAWAKAVANIHNIILKTLDSLIDDIIKKWSDKIFINTTKWLDIKLRF